MKQVAVCVAVFAWSAAGLRADFSYEQTTRIAGGAMAGIMKTFGGGKPAASTVLVKGSRMATISGDTATVIDVDAETMTFIDYQKKQYSVMTFAQMREAMEKMAQKVKQDARVDMDFKVDVKETGKTRSINGTDAREAILTMRMESTDPQSGQKGTMAVVTDLWLARSLPGYEEVRKLQLKMAQKVNWAPGTSSMFRAQPGMQRGIEQMTKEAAKLEGIPLLQLMRMGMVGPGGTLEPPSPDAPPAPSGPTVGEAAGQAAGDAAGGAAAGAVGSRLGRLGGLAGGLGGLGRRRKEEPQTPQQPAAGQPRANPVMIEMHTELTSFSDGPVDAARMNVPSGFKQVEHEMIKAAK